MSRFWHQHTTNRKGASNGECDDSSWIAPVAAVSVAVGAAAIAYRLWSSRKQQPKQSSDSSASSSASSAASADAARAALYNMPAYTSLTLAQAQEIFDAFRPPSVAAAAAVASGDSIRRFVVESLKELMGGLSNSNYKITVRDTRAASIGSRNNSASRPSSSKPAVRTYLLKICEEKNDAELRAQVRALGLIRSITLDERIPLAHPQFERPCRISYPYRVGLPADADSDDEDEDAESSAPALAPASSVPGDEYLLHLPSISPRALIFYEYLDGQMLRPSSASIPAALREVARAQAQLHSIPLRLGDAPARAFDFLECVPFGMFAVSEQYRAQVADSAAGAVLWASHPFIRFLQPFLPVLAQALQVAPQLPQAVIHSDLFLENMIFAAEQADAAAAAASSSSSSSSSLPSAAAPRLLGLIDFEEMGVGPRLLDLSMTVVGCCYRSDESLDVAAAAMLLRSYDEFAPLTPRERSNFVSYLEWSLLSIAYWRWQNFNVVHPEPNDRKQAYLPMQRRVEDLQNPALRASIEALLLKA